MVDGVLWSAFGDLVTLNGNMNSDLLQILLHGDLTFLISNRFIFQHVI